MLDDQELRAGVGRTLSGGSLAAASLILAGLLLGFVPPASGAATLLLRAGTLCLIATPPLASAVLAAGFARAGQRRFAWVCAGLLAMIALCAVLGAVR